MALTLRRAFLRLTGGAAATGALALAGCTDDDRPEPAVRIITITPEDAADQTPESFDSDLPVFDPGEVVARLVGGPSPLPGLPEKFTLGSYEASEPSPYFPDAVRVLTYTLTGLDYQNSIVYYVHADAAAARNGFGSASVNRGFRTDRLEGLPYPARVVNFKTEQADIGYTVITVVAGQAVIETLSALAVTSPMGNFTHAWELAVVAIAHLEAALAR